MRKVPGSLSFKTAMARVESLGEKKQGKILKITMTMILTHLTKQFLTILEQLSLGEPSPWSLEMPGLYQNLELSWTNLAFTLMSASSLLLCCVDPQFCSPTGEENVTWCVCEGAEDARSRELCP